MPSASVVLRATEQMGPRIVDDALGGRFEVLDKRAIVTASR
jgi:hypothetical protein